LKPPIDEKIPPHLIEVSFREYERRLKERTMFIERISDHIAFSIADSLKGDSKIVI
jgi:hypothetical protein